MGPNHFFGGSWVKFKLSRGLAICPHLVLGNVEVAGCGFQAAMAHQDLDGAQIGARFQQMLPEAPTAPLRSSKVFFLYLTVYYRVRGGGTPWPFR